MNDRSRSDGSGGSAARDIRVRKWTWPSLGIALLRDPLTGGWHRHESEHEPETGGTPYE